MFLDGLVMFPSPSTAVLRVAWSRVATGYLSVIVYRDLIQLLYWGPRYDNNDAVTPIATSEAWED